MLFPSLEIEDGRMASTLSPSSTLPPNAPITATGHHRPNYHNRPLLIPSSSLYFSSQREGGRVGRGSAAEERRRAQEKMAAVVPRAQLTRKTIPLPLSPPRGTPSDLRSSFLPPPRRPLLLPRPATASGFSMRVARKQAYICRDCGYIYSDRKPFEKLPDSYFCPVCGAPKRRFRSYQPAVAKNANEMDVRKARKVQLKREEAIGNALPIGIAIGAALLAALYFYLNSIY